MTSAEKYVTAAYAVVLAVVLLYVVIYAFKMARLQREVELAELAARRRRTRTRTSRPRARASRVMGELALVLIWPALIGYGEAAVAYVGETIRPGGSPATRSGACVSAGSPRPRS